ncbi:hypothetical protein N431DRAFT_478594 [Stipitochalara longipes BDJ]|nr:hypothetical protein N431DRAFT_478594 [Stipitochalara longipes BDJ]
MEVVRLVPSLGQALDGINQLRTFFKDVTGARQKTADLLKELEGLTTTLADIRRLIISFQLNDGESDYKSAEAAITPYLSSLASSLEPCVQDVSTWIQAIENVDPTSKKGWRRFFKKVEVAVGKSGFQEMGGKISSHQQQLGICLSVLGRSLDQTGFARLDKLSTKLDGLTGAHLKLNDSINNQLAARAENQITDETFSEIIGSQLRPLGSSIEDRFDQMSLDHSESQQSIQSLSQSISSIASQMSRLLEMANLSDTSHEHSVQAKRSTSPDVPEPEDEWCCDAISGIDDGFDKIGNEHYSCIYCPFVILHIGPDGSQEKGRHLAEAHSFGSCNLMTTYQSWDDLAVHLYAFHNMKGKTSQTGAHFRRKKRLLSLFRDEVNGSDHPSTVIEQSTAGIIMEAGLQMALDEFNSGPIPRHQAFEFLAHDLRVEDIFLKLRYKIACLLEELIMSGNDKYIGIIPSSNFIAEHRMKRASLLGKFNQRRNVNVWFLQTLEESLLLRLLLACGKVTQEMAPATSPDWLAPILALWSMDEAATGVECEQIFVPSDGAVDSRDDLNTNAASAGLKLGNKYSNGCEAASD